MADLKRAWQSGLRRAACVVWAAGVQLAVAAPPASGSDLTLDERVNRVASELRCVVCQNQSIADSHAELAVQLKGEVRKQLARGDSETQVREFMVQRYGDFVLYRPPLTAATALLWGGPALLLLLGLGLLVAHWRERRKAFEGAPDSVWPVTDEDKAQP